MQEKNRGREGEREAGNSSIEAIVKSEKEEAPVNFDGNSVRRNQQVN